ncbi:MAG TPA: hypothetical protein VIL88_07025 [Devosia sp.]|jgi:hypothetical protein|uniref:hypothetical protein n=1 Tax=Devosia sp. TaxID=1871048 RepID=UPI002F942A38
MKLWSAVSNAAFGWAMILRGEPGWRDRFTLTPAGVATALIVFALVAFVAVAIAAMGIGMPSLPGVLAAILVLAVPILALWLALVFTRKLLKQGTPFLPILVPGVYALTAFLLVEGFLAMIGGPIVMLAWAGMGYLVYCLARRATEWNTGIAAAFSVLSVVLLVALRMALYMLSTLAPPI